MSTTKKMLQSIFKDDRTTEKLALLNIPVYDFNGYDRDTFDILDDILNLLKIENGIKIFQFQNKPNPQKVRCNKCKINFYETVIYTIDEVEYCPYCNKPGRLININVELQGNQ